LFVYHFCMLIMKDWALLMMMMMMMMIQGEETRSTRDQKI
jgi:hypothetical protein